MKKLLIISKIALVTVFILASNLVFSQTSDRKYVSFNQIDNRLEVTVSDGKILFTPYSSNAIEAEFIPTGYTNPPSNAISAKPSSMASKVRENPVMVSFTHQNLSVKIMKNPFQVMYYFNNKPILSEENGYYDSISMKGFRMYLDDKEILMGGGERVLGMDRRGNRLRLYNRASYGYETHADLMYYSMPVVISSNKYMIAFDNGADGWLDLGSTQKNILEFEAVGGRMAYLLVAANNWSDLFSQFTEVTGRQPMLPRWTLGNITSRMGYHSQKQVESVVDTYIQNDIPLDGLVLDLYWFGKDLKGTLGELEWYRDSFPEPEQMMRKLKGQGVHTVLITEPFVLENIGKFNECKEKKLFATDTLGNPFMYDFYFGHTALLDVFKPETRDWFWDIYKRHTTSGVDAWWGDLGEPEVHPSALQHVNGSADEVHNLYGHEWAKIIYEGFGKDFPDRRPVILMRSGFVGSQRYGMLPWSGDVNRSWGGLQPQVEISLQMGMQGLAYMSSDLGGFAGAYKDAELYTRWLQYGVFQPVYRTHAQEEVPAEPIYWDDATKDIVRRYIKLRYEMLPYNYTLMQQNSANGTLLMRPLFFVDNKADLLTEKSEYLWGESFLVSPVVTKGATSQTVYLPKGSNWFGLFDRQKFAGGQTITVPLDIQNIPVFVKAGSLIPMAESAQSTSQYDPTKLKVMFYFDPEITESLGYMYEDDGATKDAFDRKMYEMFEFSAQTSNNETTVAVASKGYEYKGKPVKRQITLVIPTLAEKPAKVTVGGQKVKIGKAALPEYPGKPYAYWDKEGKSLHVVAEAAAGQGVNFGFVR